MTGEQFQDWLKGHRALHRRSDWPTGDDAITFFGCWLSTFKIRDVRPEEADDASRWLAERGGAFPDNHLGLLLGRIEARRREGAASASARRFAERRAEADAEKARDAELLSLWDSLAEFDRQRIEAEVEHENPGLVRFPYFVRRLAMDQANREFGRAEGSWR